MGCRKGDTAMRSLILLSMLAFLGCAGETGPAGAIEAEGVVEVVDSMESHDEGGLEATDDAEDDGDLGSCWPEEYYGPVTLEEMITTSVVIARVSLLSVEPTAEASELHPSVVYVEKRSTSTVHVPTLTYTFSVHEYLKGGGGSTIAGRTRGWDTNNGCVELLEYETMAEAQAVAPGLLEARDSRWDNREAIIFLRPNNWLGIITLNDSSERITVAGRHFKAWLPDATPSATSTVPDAERRFLLDDPDNLSPYDIYRPAGTSTVQGAPQVPSITLGALKQEIAAVTAEYGPGDGTLEYAGCISAMFKNEKKIARLLAKDPTRYDTPIISSFTTESGQATGTVLIEWRTASAYSDPFTDYYGREWLEGGDSQMFRIEHPGYIYAERPQPAGEYRFFYNFLRRVYMACNYYPEIERNRQLVIFTVTAPAGTLAESFFDPYADGSAVMGTSTVGTISWEAGQVEATLTQDVTGHVLDFIALDGSVSLSLDVADATADSGTLTWSVASQPWSAGDQLMLRIRRSETPAATPTPTPP